jgi:hypothetical protein
MKKVYQSKKDLPSHKRGDYLIYNNESRNYEWLNYPHFNFDTEQVENSSDFFDEIEVPWDEKEDIYFLNNDFQIIHQKYNTDVHLHMVLSGNGFKNIELATEFKNKIEGIRNGKFIAIEKSDFLLLKMIENEDVKKIIYKYG